MVYFLRHIRRGWKEVVVLGKKICYNYKNKKLYDAKVPNLRRQVSYMMVQRFVCSRKLLYSD